MLKAAYKARAKTVEEKFARLNSSKANLEEQLFEMEKEL